MADVSSGALNNFNIVFFPETTGTYYLRVSRFTETVPFLYNLRYYRTSPPSITLTMPSGGEVVEDESNLVLMWTREGTPDIPAVSIEYSLTGADGPWLSIEDSTGNSGLYIWTLPNLDATSHDCYVHISEFELGRVVGMNDIPFTIIDVSSIGEKGRLPEDFAISAYPNPFNSAVTITVAGVGATHELPLRVEIFDMNGRLVADAEPANKPLAVEAGAGRLGKDTSTSSVSVKSPLSKGDLGALIWRPDPSLGSGVYLVRACFGPSTQTGCKQGSGTSDGNIATKRIVYLK